MDTALNNGDFLKDGRGYPVTIWGKEEILQRVLIRLSSKRGEFIYDRRLGSRLYELKNQTGNRDDKALNLAREAVADMSGVALKSVKTAQTDEGLRFEVSVIIGDENGEVAFTI